MFENLFNSLKKDLFLISGPCVIENNDMVMKLAEKIGNLCQALDITYIFKASFDKANRTSKDSYRGPGLEEGLNILEKVKKEFNLPVLTDIHECWQIKPAAEVCDIIQVPAFLCRQTDLLVESGKTGKIINIKKAQFLSGSDMIHPVKKVESTGNKKIMLTERGSLFGYGDLVVDYRNIIEMKKFDYPVIMDVTHSTQKPGGLGGRSGGNREYAKYLADAAAAVGVRGFFFETHESPDSALSDGPNMITPEELKKILSRINNIANI